MKILNQCKNSVLWLLKENNQGAINILKEASKKGRKQRKNRFCKENYYGYPFKKNEVYRLIFRYILMGLILQQVKL